MKRQSARRHGVLERLRSQRKAEAGWRKHEVLCEAADHNDVGQIFNLEEDISALRVRFFDRGFRDVVDRNLYKLRRRDIQRTEVYAGDPNTYRVIYFHDVLDKKTLEIVGEVQTRLFRAPGVGSSWAIKLIVINGVEIKSLQGL